MVSAAPPKERPRTDPAGRAPRSTPPFEFTLPRPYAASATAEYGRDSTRPRGDVASTARRQPAAPFRADQLLHRAVTTALEPLGCSRPCPPARSRPPPRRSSPRSSSSLLPLSGPPPPPPPPPPKDDRSRPLVYVFVLDGLDGDRVRQRRALAPNLNALLDGRGGARSTLYEESRSVMVAETYPNHVAMASGAYRGQSGIPGKAFAVYGKTRDEDSCPTGSLDESKPPRETSGESPDRLEADTFFEAVAKGPARTRSPPPGSSASRSSAGSSRVSRLRAGSSPTTCSRPARRRAAATTPPTARTCSSVPPAPAPTTASSWTRSSRRRARAFGPTGRASGRT